MKRVLVVGFIVLCALAAPVTPPVMAAVESDNMFLIGRNAMGPTEAASVYGNYLVMGNGAYLEIYEIFGTRPFKQKRGSILMPDVVKDIYVDGQTAYVACNGAGLITVDISVPGSPIIRGQFDQAQYAPNGQALGVFVFGTRAYVADGLGGLVILDVSNPAVLNPPVGMYSAQNTIVRDVQVDISGSKTVAYVAADTAGLWTVDVSAAVQNEPVRLARIKPNGMAKAVTLSPTLAYVAMGNGGLTQVNITNPAALWIYRVWKPGELDLDITDVFVSSFKAYCTDANFGMRILDVSDDISAPISNLSTRGNASRITLTNTQRAFIADGGGGLLMLNLDNPAQPARIDSIQTGDSARDIAYYGNTMYVAGGKSGLWILNRAQANQTGIPTAGAGNIDTLRACGGVVVRDTLLFVSNGRNGVKIMSIKNPIQPRMITSIKVPDAAYDVDFDGNRAVIAGGTGGIHIMNILDPKHPTDLGTVSLGGISAIKVKVDAGRHVGYVATDAGMRVVDLDAKTLIATCAGTNNSFASDLNENNTTLYVADGVNGVLVYDVSNPGTPRQIQGMTYNTPGAAYDIRMKGNAAVVADGEGTVRILDMSVSPIEVGFAHTGGASLGIDVHGDTVTVADGEAGIYLFKTNFAGTLSNRENALNFGSVVLGRSRTLHLSLTNTGTREIRIQKVSSTSGRFVSGTSSTVSIYPNQTYWLPVVFWPAVVQEVTDQIKIESDASNPVVLVDVRGSGLSFTPLDAYAADYSTYALYHMDSLDGDTLVVDDSQYGYLDGKANGATLLETAASKFNRSLKFTASTTVQVNLDSAGHLPESDGFTVDTWLCPITAQTGKKTIFRLAQGGRVYFELGVKDLTSTKRGLYGLTMPNSEDIVEVVSDSTRALRLNEWVHAALVYRTNNRMILYLNGTPLDTMEVPFSIPNSGLEMKLGNTGEAGGFDGALDEFRLSGVARDPWEFNVCTGRIQMATEGLNFGNILMPNHRSLSVTVRNTGAGQLWVDSVKTTNPRFTVSPATFTLGPGASQMLWVTFTPNAAGTMNALLGVYSRDPVTPILSMLLTGFGMTQGTTGAYTLDVYTNALWHMDWVKGDTAVTDTSANRLIGRFSGSGVSKSAIFPKYGTGSLYFDGTAGWVRIPSHAALDFVNSAFTVETWFRMNSKPAASDYDVLVRRGVKNNCQYELLYGDSLVNGRGITARVYASTGQAYTLTGPPDAEMNMATWYNAALTWDRSMLRLYQNGLCVDSTAFAGSLRASSEPVAAGGNYGLNAYFNGYLDELRFSNTARQPWEFNVTGPRLYASTESVVFDQILLGESPSTSFQITNGGDQPLSVTGMTWKKRVFSVSPSTFKVPIGSALNIQVAFRPTATGAIRDTLIIASNDPTGPARQIILSATVVDYRAKLAYPLDDYTIALYHFDETTNVAKINDANANKHNGDLFNTPERITGGYFSGAVRLNGLNQYGIVPQSEDISFDPETQSYTFECFFRTDTISEALLYKDISGGLEKPNWGLAIDNAGRLTVPGFGAGSAWVADNAWHHTAFVYDHLLKLGSLYVDGSLQFQQPLTPEKTDTKTKGALTIGARQVATNVFVDHFTGDIDELRISDRARKPWEFLFARSGIDVSLSGTPLAGSAQTVLISIRPEAGSKTLTLFHRKTGETAYASVAASSVNDSTYRAIIPADGITSSGLEFYVQKTAGAGTSTQPVYDPVNRPISTSVRFASMASGLTLPAKKYTMISAPAELAKPSVKDVLRDDMGAYDPYTWRLFAWKDTSYAEYSDSLSSADSASFNFTAGKAFWIITSEAKTYDVDAGSSVSSAGPFHETLKAQWNMVSSPFTFPVSWDDCALSSDSIGTLYTYDGTGYRLDWPTFEPWKGYFVFNAQTRPATVYVPPRKAATTGTLPKRGILNDLADGDWVLRLSAETADAKDLDNFIGVRDQAEKAWDVFDRLEPPPMGEYVSLFVEHPDWNRNPGPYAADIRAAGEPGYVWEFTLETRLIGKPVSLKWNLTKALPEGWVAYLIDADEGVSINLMEKAGTQVETGKQAPNHRRLKILVGSREFVEAQSEIPLRPVEFGLSQNYPNPFNPRTTIEYALPKNGRVRLTVYNMMGQRIRVLLDQDEKKGFHKVVWDGDNDRGLRTSSGLYIYRLEFLDKVAVRKLVLVK
jgi:hypothetical protein